MQNNNVKSPNFENRNPATFIHIFPLNSTLGVVCGLRWRGNLASLQEVSIYSTYSQNSLDKWNVIFDRSFTARLKLTKSVIKILRYNTKYLLNIFFSQEDVTLTETLAHLPLLQTCLLLHASLKVQLQRELPKFA